MNNPAKNLALAPCGPIRRSLFIAATLIMIAGCASTTTINSAGGTIEVPDELSKSCECGQEDACAMVAKEIRQHGKNGLKDDYDLYIEYAKKAKYKGAADLLAYYFGPHSQDIQKADLEWALSVGENYCLNESLGLIETTKKMCDLVTNANEKLGRPKNKEIEVRLCQLGWVSECRKAGIM